MRSSKKETVSKGVSTNVCSDGSLKEDLRNVINLMGPNTSQSDIPNDSDVSIHESCKCKNRKVAIEDVHSSNTPNDISEYSSIPTDSVEVYLEPRCFCPSQDQITKHVSRKDMLSRKLSNFLSFNKTKEDKDALDLYKINIIQTKDDSSPPRRVIFDLVDELPKASRTNAATNTNRRSSHVSACANCNNTDSKWNVTNMVVKHDSCTKTGKFQKNNWCESSGPPPAKSILKCGNYNLNDLSRVDVYYFDHGNSAFYHTTDSPPVIMMEILAEKTENYTMKFWAEIFGTIHVGFSFFTSFVLQLFRFIFHSLIRPLTIGILQLFSDYCIKPSLATIFNALVQPPLIFIYNVCTSLRDICDPIAEGFGYFMREFSVICKSMRLVENRTTSCQKRVSCQQVDKAIECNCDEEGRII